MSLATDNIQVKDTIVVDNPWDVNLVNDNLSNDEISVITSLAYQPEGYPMPEQLDS